jgi:hypothetical protein
MVLALNSDEQAFVQQKEGFLTKALQMLGAGPLDELSDPTERLPLPLPPVIIEDYRSLTEDAKSALNRAYWGGYGAAHFIVLNPDEPATRHHPVLEIAEQLSNLLPLQFPVDHPMEGHSEAVSRFGAPDGTLKIYDLDKDGRTGYRECHHRAAASRKGRDQGYDTRAVLERTGGAPGVSSGRNGRV